MQTNNDRQGNIRVEIRESISSSLWTIIILIFLVGYGLYKRDKVGTPTSWVLIVILFLVFCVLIFKVYTLVKRRVVVLIDDQGIHHKDFKLLKWDDILSIRKARKDLGDSEIVYFLFQTSHSAEPYKITISNLDISETELISLIHKFRDYNIFETTYDKW